MMSLHLCSIPFTVLGAVIHDEDSYCTQYMRSVRSTKFGITEQYHGR